MYQQRHELVVLGGDPEPVVAAQPGNVDGTALPDLLMDGDGEPERLRDLHVRQLGAGSHGEDRRGHEDAADDHGDSGPEQEMKIGSALIFAGGHRQGVLTDRGQSPAGRIAL